MNAYQELTSTIDPFLDILAPTSRSSDIHPEQDLYGFFVGSWELDVVAYPDDGSVTHSIGEAHCARVLDGRAIQDVFIHPKRLDRTSDSPKFANWYGITFRYFDLAIRAWRVFWFNPDDGIRAELIGRRRGNEIVQEGQFPDGTRIRWTFSEITPSSCRWRGERLEHDGKTWRLQVEFRARRVSTEIAAPWLNSVKLDHP
jgi:hypothetical protein